MVTHTRNLCSAFNPSKVRTHSSEHTHTINTHMKKTKKFTAFLWCGKFGGVFGEGGGEMVHVSGGRGLHGVSEGGGVI